VSTYEAAGPPVDPRIWKRRVAVTREQGRKRLRIVAAVLGVCAIAAGGFAAIHSSLFAARHLNVVGAVHTPAAEVLAMSGLSDRPPLVDINAAEVAARIEALPWVKSAVVIEHWPDSVTVKVTERSALAAVESGSVGQAAWALVDGTGRVLADQATRPAGLPALSVPVAPGAPGSALPPGDQPAVEIASSMPPLLAERVRSVEVAVDGDVTLGMTGGFTAVIGSPTELEAKYEALASVLAGAPLLEGDVIDVSVPDEPAVGPAGASESGGSTGRGAG
jgi:cell division protein FtsQ